MGLDELVKDFENAKAKVDPILEKQRLILPIYRIPNGPLEGDGFFYGGDNELAWKYGGTGHSLPATPEGLVESYEFYMKTKVTKEDALQMATRALNEGYEELMA